MLKNTDETPINYTACCTLADLTHQPTIEAEKIKNAKRGEINFYLCDNIEFMKTKPNKYYDLAIVDPPYGIDITGQFENANKEGSKSMFKQTKGIVNKKWDKNVPTAEYFEQLKRVSKDQIIWGGNYFLEHLGNTKCMLIWDKMNGTNNMADAEIAWTSLDNAVRMFRLHHFSKSYEPKIHLTQKPKQLYRWILLNFATKGMKILDTHGGSFTIARACDDEGFELDVCEIDEEYYNNGLKAYDEYKRQTKLF